MNPLLPMSAGRPAANDEPKIITYLSIREDVAMAALIIIMLVCFAWVCFSFYEFVIRPKLHE